jgi:hypothetical protein
LNEEIGSLKNEKEALTEEINQLKLNYDGKIERYAAKVKELRDALVQERANNGSIYSSEEVSSDSFNKLSTIMAQGLVESHVGYIE